MMLFKRKRKQKEQWDESALAPKLTAKEKKEIKRMGLFMCEYMNYVGRPWHIIWSNILAGISRGIGLTLGVALVVYATVKILTFLISARFPWLSDASSELMHVIKTTPGLERYTQAVEDAKHKQHQREIEGDIHRRHHGPVMATGAHQNSDEQKVADHGTLQPVKTQQAEVKEGTN